MKMDETGQPVATTARWPRVWSVFAVFIISIMLYLVAAGVCMTLTAVALYRGPLNSEEDLRSAISDGIDSPVAVLAACAAAGAVLTGMSLLAAFLSPVPWRQRLNLRQPRITAIGLLAAVLGTLSVSASLLGLDSLGLLPESPALETIGEAITALQGPSLLVGLLLIGVLPGISEELLFRGYVQTRLVSRWGVPVGVVISAFLFGLMHMDVTQGAFAMVIGLVLGYLTVWSGSIIPAMICHAANNSLAVLLMIYTPDLQKIEGLGSSLALVATSIVVGSLSMWFLRNRGTQRVTEETVPSIA